MTKIENSLFLIENPVLIGFLKIIDVENQLHIKFGKSLKHTKILLEIPPHKHKFLIFHILVHIKTTPYFI